MASLIRTEVFHCSLQQLRASIQRLENRLGAQGWFSSKNVRIVFGEYPYTSPTYRPIPNVTPGYTITGTYVWRDDCDELANSVKRPATRASWEVVLWNSSSMRPRYDPQRGRYSAGIEAYEESDNCTRVDFFDGYSPVTPQQGYLPIGYPFEEFCQMIVEEIQPESILALSKYEKILRVLYRSGKQLERTPSTYVDKNEEDLRDLFLVPLESHFEGSATGETFNKTGKTDILLRQDSSNLFIAECKIWRGEKQFIEAITQLIAYLTWRDSKTALVLFVRNKNFSSVLEIVENATPKHPNYLRYVEKTGDTWFNYHFHLNDDPHRIVKLAMLLFHFPE